MASFGSFETEREVYSDLVYSVFTARKQEDPEGEYAVKLFRSLSHGLEAELAAAAASREEVERSRLNSISVQEQAAAGSGCIAPVLERGQDARGIWYATRFYPRSVNKMMSGKVALPRASLEHIIRSITQGALDFKRACGRSHGDIRPTNVQVSKTEKLTEAQVLLSDPLPGGTDQASEFELSDLHAIGLILLQLVRQRTISAEDAALMFPISPGSEWTRVFGSDAGDWLAICNRLLDPHLSLEHFSLEALRARLDELQPRRADSSKLVTAAAAVVLILLALGVWALWPRSQIVQLTSDPPGATIMVDEVQQSKSTPLEVKLKPGSHVIEARLDPLGLAPLATNCVVQKGAGGAILFQFAFGSVSIKSEPAGAAIFKAGVSLGRTPSDGRPFLLNTVPPGSFACQLRLDEYEPADVTGVVSNQQTVHLFARLNPLKKSEVPPPVDVTKNTHPPAPANGLLELRAQPVQAVVLDEAGHELGRASPDTALQLTLPAGMHPFTAHAEGLSDVTASISIEPGKTTQYTFRFDGGTVEWSSQPVSATVSLAGQSRMTPATFVQKSGVAVTYVIKAPGFRTETNAVTIQAGQHKPMVAKLVPLNVDVELVSDPPGAQFFAENGSALVPKPGNQALYSLPCGATTLVARYGRLGSVTNRFTVAPDKADPPVRFKFDYGTLVLTNLPPDAIVFDGQTKIASATDRFVYEPSGRRVYAVRARTGTQNLSLTINSSGLSFLKMASAEKSWKNSVAMWFAWVPNLPGGGTWPGQSEPGGWVAISELTQGQYKKMDGSNPSFYQDGGDNFPVENLTWEQAVSFCRWLSATDTAERSGWRYSLPDDQQFIAFTGNADRIARVTSEGRMTSTMDDALPLQRTARLPSPNNPNNARTHPEAVASTGKANQFGLYDVIGNVWEWLADPAAKEHSYAGGSYLNFSAKSLVARSRERGLEKGPNIGFRVILVPPP